MLEQPNLLASISLTATMPALLVDASVKVTLLLAIAGTVTFLLRRQSAAQRHAIWCAAILGTILLPVATVLLPSWPILPQWLATSHVAETASAITSDQPERTAATELHRHPSRPPTPESGPATTLLPQDHPNSQAIDPSNAVVLRRPATPQPPQDSFSDPISPAIATPFPLPSARTVVPFNRVPFKGAHSDMVRRSWQLLPASTFGRSPTATDPPSLPPADTGPHSCDPRFGTSGISYSRHCPSYDQSRRGDAHGLGHPDSSYFAAVECNTVECRAFARRIDS